MLQQRTLKSLTRAVGVGLHSGQRVELTLRPAQPDTGIVFRRVDLPQPVDIPMSATAVTDTRLASTHVQRRRQGAHRGAPDVGLRRPGHGQPVRGHHGRRGADPGRFGGLVRVPAAKRGHRTAEGAAPLHPRDHSRWKCARARAPAPEVGAAGALPRLQAQFRDRLRPPGGGFHRPARGVRHEHRLLLRATSRAPAPSASPRTSR